MNGSMPNHEMVTQYLLGALAEAETGRCDELSIADDEFAALLKATERDLIDAYVTGQLTGTTLEQFESVYLGSPLRRDKVQFARVFQDCAKQKATPQRSANHQPTASKTNWISRLGVFSAPRLAWGLALVALILVVAIGWLSLQNFRLRQQVFQARVKRDELLQSEQKLQEQIASQQSVASQAEQQLAQVRAERERLEQELRNNGQQLPSEGRVISMALAPPLRGANQVPVVTIRPGDGVISAQLRLEAADYPNYRVSLTDSASGRKLWTSGQLAVKRKGDSPILNVNFPTSLLRTQTYALRVSGVLPNGAAEVVSDYPFRVVK